MYCVDFAENVRWGLIYNSHNHVNGNNREAKLWSWSSWLRTIFIQWKQSIKKKEHAKVERYERVVEFSVTSYQVEADGQEDEDDITTLKSKINELKKWLQINCSAYIKIKHWWIEKGERSTYEWSEVSPRKTRVPWAACLLTVEAITD